MAVHSSLKQYYLAVSRNEAKLATLLELLAALQVDHSRPFAVCCSSRDSLDAVAHALLDSQQYSICVLHSDMTEKERELQLGLFKRLAGLRSDTTGADMSASSSGFGLTSRPYSSAGGSAGALADIAEPGQTNSDKTTGSASEAGRAAAAAVASAPPTTSSSSASQSSQASTTARASIASASGLEPGVGAAARSFARTSIGSGAGAAPMVLITTDVCLKAAPKDLLPVGVPMLVQFDLPYKKDIYTRRLSTMFGGGKERRGHRSIVIDLVVAGELPAFRATERMSSGLIQEMPVHVLDVFAS